MADPSASAGSNSHQFADAVAKDRETLFQLAMSPVFMFREFLENGIEPIATRARRMPDDEREEFYVHLLPHLVSHCTDLEVPVPYETALFLVSVVKCRV